VLEAPLRLSQRSSSGMQEGCAVLLREELSRKDYRGVGRVGCVAVHAFRKSGFANLPLKR
jgi:hypothetical protein